MKSGDGGVEFFGSGIFSGGVFEMKAGRHSAHGSSVHNALSATGGESGQCSESVIFGGRTYLKYIQEYHCRFQPYPQCNTHRGYSC